MGALRLALGPLALALFSSAAAVQGGWLTEKHPELGLTFPRARNYEQIPTPPDEPYVVLYFAEKVPEKVQDRKEVRPELDVVWIDKVPDPSGGVGTEPEGRSKRRRPINGLSRYLEEYWPKWKLGPPVEGKTRDGYDGTEYTLTPAPELRESRVGWAYSYKTELRTIAFLGFCAEEDLRDQVKIWRYMAERVDISEPEEQGTEKLERMYARLALPSPEYRIGVRKKLVRGWKAEDTPHYIVIYDTTDQPLVKKIVRDLELLNAEYRKLFPPVMETNSVSTVRVCKDRDEYLSYGGPEWTSGFWNWETEELVLYDAERVERHVKIDSDTFETLYHEAFHQYIHYACGELPPHSWFNEGHGDFFAGATIKDGRVRGIDVLPMYATVIAWAIEENRFVPWEAMIRYEQSQYYDPDKVAICYSQGWSMIYFLRKGKKVEKRPEWARILPTYFETLKAVYGEALAELADGGKKGSPVERAKAGFKARNKATDAAFAGVDLKEIEAEWAEFVRGMAIPR